MNLLSCDGCGVVLDVDKIGVPDIHDAGGVGYDTEVAMYIDGRYVPSIKCPICGMRTPLEDWKEF